MTLESMLGEEELLNKISEFELEISLRRVRRQREADPASPVKRFWDECFRSYKVPPYSVCWLTFNSTPTLASITNKLDPP